ncbi:MAG: lipoyl(octanoyl) transferase LipB [Planctomycetota bacterium]
MPNQPPITVCDLGLLDYDQALSLQRELNQSLIDGKAGPTVLLVEHPSVITLTRRAKPNLLADEPTLAKLGVATTDTDRGGDITYHGPGQLVVYPILKLGDFGLNLSSYMRLLERAVIETIVTWGVAGHTECGATGVWVKQDGQPDAKVCAMGVRIRKNTTMHGIALNVAPEMSHFDLIVPCGLEGRPVVSMQQLLGGDCPTMSQVKEVFTRALLDCLQNTGESSACATGSAPGTSAGS